MLAALVALLFQALIPPGYMLASGQGSGPTVTICTGHGPLRIDDPAGRHAPPRKGKAAGICAFAGHGAPPIPAASPRPAPIRWSLAAPSGPAAHLRVFLGRRLAAPPPARGPPASLA
jgi:hypothetical protein